MTDDNLPAGTTVWVFGDQLNRRIGALGMARPETHRILFVEATEQIAGRRYHGQGLHLVLAGMRRLSAELRAAGFDVDHRAAPTLLAGLEAHRAEHRPSRVAATEPLSWGLRRMLQRHDVDLVRSNQFLCHPDEFARWAAGTRRLRLEDFYRWQRRRLGYLMDGDEPAGGRWNFDADNRRPPPRDGRDWPDQPPRRWTTSTEACWRTCRRHLSAPTQAAGGRGRARCCRGSMQASCDGVGDDGGVEYEVVAEAYRDLELASGRLMLIDRLATLLAETPKELLPTVCYLCQGQVAPEFAGVDLGLAEKMALRAVATATGVEPEVVVAAVRESGDLGQAAEQLLATTAADRKPSLQVAAVVDTLHEIAGSAGSGSQGRKLELLAGLLTRATPLEARYLLRLVTGNLRLGIGTPTILDALAQVYAGSRKDRPVLERAYNICCDLGLVAATLATGGLTAVKELRVRAGNPVRVMLAQRLSEADEILARLGGQCMAEYKYDGMRLQAHRTADGQIELFTRRQERVSTQFPDVVELLQTGLGPREAILEGEVVAYDAAAGELRPFQEVMFRRRKHGIAEAARDVPVGLFCFELLYADGEDLTQLPYLDRRARLAEALTLSDRLRLTTALEVTTAPALDAAFEQAVADGSEGLVCKSIGSNAIYQAGARGWMWIKLKRDYRTELADTVDLVVVGAYAGRGRRTGTYGAVLLAAYNPAEELYQTVGRCGTGFSDAELAALPERLAPFRRAQRPARIDSRVPADVWFEPSVVMEVLSAELTLSPNHTAGWGQLKDDAGLSMRFPRFTGRWRDDKEPQDATTTDQLVQLFRTAHRVSTGA